jgi:uncharacterized protein with ParB-like and HNH nuclease domain
MQEIQGQAKTVRQLMSVKYAIDYYQREYKWETKQIQELLEDLTEKFLEDYRKEHSPIAVKGYGRYFLGSIIISKKDDTSGYQRRRLRGTRPKRDQLSAGDILPKRKRRL